MIGVNDIESEVFNFADAQALEDFARTKGIGMLSMWSERRDTRATLPATPLQTRRDWMPGRQFQQYLERLRHRQHGDCPAEAAQRVAEQRVAAQGGGSSGGTTGGGSTGGTTSAAAVSFTKTNDWTSGFNGDVTVTNTGTRHFGLAAVLRPWREHLVDLEREHHCRTPATPT